MPEDAPLSPEAREKLLKELKRRLEEIENLKRQLDLAPTPSADSSESPLERESPFTAQRVQEALEEIIVPPLELLEDKPDPKKPKKASGST